MEHLRDSIVKGVFIDLDQQIIVKSVLRTFINLSIFSLITTVKFRFRMKMIIFSKVKIWRDMFLLLIYGCVVTESSCNGCVFDILYEFYCIYNIS